MDGSALPRIPADSRGVSGNHPPHCLLWKTERHLRLAGADTGPQIPRPNQSLSPSQVAPAPRDPPRPVTLLCPPVLHLLTPGSGLCSSLGLRAAAERGGRTPLLPSGGPPALPPLPPAAPPARPPSLTCSARHGALRGWGSPAGPRVRACVCVRV